MQKSPEENIIDNWLEENWDPKITKQVEKELNDIFSSKLFTYQDMIEASRYGYNFHKETMFPKQEFDDSCIRNTQQWLTTFYDEYPLK